MNIFWFSLDPMQNARMHCDKHVRKMCVELAQMLSSAHHVHNTPLVRHVYKLAYPNHPCTKWVCSSATAYYNTFLLFEQLCIEYLYRFGKPIKCHRLFPHLSFNPCPDVRPKSKPLAMPSKYFNVNPVKAYRNYFCGEKRHIAEWTNRPTPHWYN